MKDERIVIVTGLSGSGKSTVIKAMEDIGFFCLDNLPIALLSKLLEMRVPASSEITKLAVVIDIRGGEFFIESPRVIKELKKQGYQIEILFLECSDEVLLRRFNETRRGHPIAKERPISEGIRIERESLQELKKLAHKIIDTSGYNVHQLKDIINQYVSLPSIKRKLNIYLISFGFKYGIPFNSDIMMDVRFLPNPYFMEKFKGLTGLDEEVEHFVLKERETQRFLKIFYRLIEYSLPLYEKEGKSNLTIAIGCTGGKHRSVAVLQDMKRFLDKKKYLVTIEHRDISKE